MDNERSSLSWIVGGEKVTVQILIEAFNKIDKPIVGFFLKDRYGQTLFGENSFLSFLEKDINLFPNDILQCEFTFYMPILPSGDYSLNVAVASGTQDEHTQLHWIHDALIIRSESDSVSTGLVGIPMLDIKLNIK